MAGNLIGTDVTGTVALGNDSSTSRSPHGGYGVDVNYSPDTIVGEPGGRNVIGRQRPRHDQRRQRHPVQSTGSVVQSNFIGTDITGTVALSSELPIGIDVSTAGRTPIGGLTPTPGTGLGNVISGNGVIGIWIRG